MALTLEGSRHIPCAVSLKNADGTWNVPATLLTKRVPLGVSPPVLSRDGDYRGADAAPLACSFITTKRLVYFVASLSNIFETSAPSGGEVSRLTPTLNRPETKTPHKNGSTSHR